MKNIPSRRRNNSRKPVVVSDRYRVTAEHSGCTATIGLVVVAILGDVLSLLLDHIAAFSPSSPPFAGRQLSYRHMYGWMRIYYVPLFLIFRSEILHQYQEQPPATFDMGRHLCHLWGRPIRRGHLFHARIAHFSHRIQHLDGSMGKKRRSSL